MNEHIKAIILDIKQIWQKLDINKKFSIAVLVVALIVVGIFFLVKATEPNWTVLYSDLSNDDASAIAQSLEKSGYAYKLSDDKTAILVKNQDKDDLKLFVAQNDLIKDTSGGFELLDNLQMGSTDFKNKLTKQRIFQGELTRSIEKINGVAKARVQLADPERSVFSDEDEEPSASVVLILNPGVKLKASQILAIKNLVAYSIPRLTNDRVFITDQFGTVLSEDVSKNSSDMQTYRANFEKEASKKIKDTLETIMGKDNVSVQVSTVMDFNQTRATIESYTPNKDSDGGVVVSKQGEKESYSNPQNTKVTEQNPAPAPLNPDEKPPINSVEQAQLAQNPNVANAPLNQTAVKTTNFDENAYVNGQEENSNNKLSYEKEKSATTYAVTKEVKQVVYAPGSVVRMSVAVAVNKILTEEEKQEIENLVIAAAGMDTKRGDVVNVTSLQFTGIDKTLEKEQDKAQHQAQIMEILMFIFKNVAPVVIILLLGIVALNNFGNIFREAKKQNEEEEEVKTPSFDPYLLMQENKTTKDDFYETEMQFTSITDKKKNEIINSILANPDTAARLLSSYIKE